MLFKPHRSPKGNTRFIVGKHFERQNLVRKNNLFAENINGSATYSLSAMSATNKELTEIDALFGGTEQGVSYRLRCKLEDDRPIVTTEPGTHSFTEFEHGH
jgi:hypothetical protein